VPSLKCSSTLKFTSRLDSRSFIKGRHFKDDENFTRRAINFIKYLSRSVELGISSLIREKCPIYIDFSVSLKWQCNRSLLSYLLPKHAKKPLHYWSGFDEKLELPEDIGATGDNPKAEQEIGDGMGKDRIPQAVLTADKPLEREGAQNPRQPFVMPDTENNSCD
jgi:hypothetical protein